MKVSTAEIESFLRWLTTWHRAVYNTNKPKAVPDDVLKELVKECPWDRNGGY